MGALAAAAAAAVAQHTAKPAACATFVGGASDADSHADSCGAGACMGNPCAAICALSLEGDPDGAFCATDACAAVLQPASAAAAACPDAHKPQSNSTSPGADPFGVNTHGSALTCAAAVIALDVVPADTACSNASWNSQDGSDTGSGTPAMHLGSSWNEGAGCLGTVVTDDWRAAATEPVDGFAGESSALTGAEATVSADVMAAAAAFGEAAAEAAAAFPAFAGSNTGVTMPCEAAAAAASAAVSVSQESSMAPVAFLQRASAAASADLPVH